MKKLIAILALVACFSLSAVELETPRPEHPRPDMLRDAWQNLNGKWWFQEDPANVGEKDKWFKRDSLDEKIVVPFEVESPLSGIGRTNPANVIWYLREFEVDENLQGKRVLLRFGAADYYTKVWLNGEYLGDHKGGYSAFKFDVTDALKPGKNKLAVRVFDSKSLQQVRGKQTWRDEGFIIYFTASSGIWQTVWLEGVGPVFIERYQTIPELDGGRVKFKVFTDKAGPGHSLSIRITDPNGREVPGPASTQITSTSTELIWQVDNPMLWSPDQPNLYDLEFTITDNNGEVVDQVRSYTGLRTIEVKDGEILLNGKPFYHKFAFIHGYYYPGLYSPEDADYFRRDVEDAKRMGFNGVRVHMKVEDPLYYYWCDKLGLLLWQDMPSMILTNFETPTKEARKQFEIELQNMVESKVNHPSIIVWVPFNESWGIYDTKYSPAATSWWMDMVGLPKKIDPTRLVIDNSGWQHKDTDIFDVHYYPSSLEKAHQFYRMIEKPWGTRWGTLRTIIDFNRGITIFPPLFQGAGYHGEPIILSEFGTIGYSERENIDRRTEKLSTRVIEKLWNGIYGDSEKEESLSLIESYCNVVETVAQYPYIKGFIFVEQYDVEQELSGLQRADRSFKAPPEEIRRINDSVGFK